jgi:hypothetical protein
MTKGKKENIQVRKTKYNFIIKSKKIVRDALEKMKSKKIYLNMPTIQGKKSWL